MLIICLLGTLWCVQLCSAAHFKHHSRPAMASLWVTSRSNISSGPRRACPGWSILVRSTIHEISLLLGNFMLVTSMLGNFRHRSYLFMSCKYRTESWCWLRYVSNIVKLIMDRRLCSCRQLENSTLSNFSLFPTTSLLSDQSGHISGTGEGDQSSKINPTVP
jgi:hypothetical protein